MIKVWCDDERIQLQFICNLKIIVNWAKGHVAYWPFCNFKRKRAWVSKHFLKIYRYIYYVCTGAEMVLRTGRLALFAVGVRQRRGRGKLSSLTKEVKPYNIMTRTNLSISIPQNQEMTESWVIMVIMGICIDRE